MRIDYTVTSSDFISGGWLSLRKGPLRLSFQFYFVFGIAILSSIMGLVLAFHSNQSQSQAFPEFLIGGIVLAMHFFTKRSALKKLFQRLPLLHLPTSLDIDGSALRFVTADSDQRLSWRVYYAFAENKKVFDIFPKGHEGFTPIPKSQLTEIQITELRSHLEANLKRK